jgi:Mannosyl-glycoprotein endo-beta-N-acetylglucosaminidase
MASGSYARKPLSQQPMVVPSSIPARKTRQLPETGLDEEVQTEPGILPLSLTVSKSIESIRPATQAQVALPYRTGTIVDQFQPHPLQQHKYWLTPLICCMVGAVVCLLIVLSAGMLQRPQGSALLNYTGGKVYDLQVGGNLAGTWQSSQPIAAKVPIATSTGPYAVLGKPTITASMINRVLATYNSPAAGKGQELYAMGIQYGIDPAFALAFFMHESTFGKNGEATISLSLGNLRCIPNAACINPSGQTCQATDNSCYAGFPTWEAGFKAWYELIRNLYIAQWGLTTIEQIIPKYAPTSDHNDETAYINSLKHSIDTWRSGGIIVS